MNASIHYTIEEIRKITRGEYAIKTDENQPLSYLSLDSRKIIFPQETIFFAIKSTHHDANSFIKELYKKGVKNFVTDEHDLSIGEIPQANVILVENTVSALQKLAIHHRRKFKNLAVIGITGSNGKTVVKEWLNQLLEKEFSIARSPKSFNSQIGVPLSVLGIRPANDLAIFEAGISLPGEMKKLEKIIQPRIGIFTNIGNAHDEGFKTRREKIREKLVLFQHAEQLIFNSQNEEVVNEIKSFSSKFTEVRLFSWGEKKTDSLRILSQKKTDSATLIEGAYKRKNISITIPFIDDASIENAITCLCAIFILGKANDEVFDRFHSLYPVEMRLELKQGVNHSTIINDSYSNDLHSLSIALGFLNQQKQHKAHTLILSDILQSGLRPEELYQRVALLLQQNKIGRLFAIGPDIFSKKNQFYFLKNKSFYRNTDDFLKNLAFENFRDETILIKGARQFEFEKISHALEQKVHQTVLSVDLNALVFNLKKYKEKLLPGTKIMAMVKAFSYGSGSHEIASVLEYNKLDYLAVAYADEGVELRKAGSSLPIMVMNTDSSTFDSLVNFALEPEIFSFNLLSDLLNYLKSSKKVRLPVHIKIDTGMHRLGFLEDEMEELIRVIAGNRSIKVKSAFTHLAASDDRKQDAFTFQQFAIFKRCCKKLEQGLGYAFDKHISNTSAISRHPELQMDMVRLGIGLYGIDNDKKMQKELKNVSTLTTTISQIKKLKSGETVGYGRHGKLEKDSVIATVRIGYADGYPRNIGNGIGKMIIKGKAVPVIGNVCMDMTMLDITGLKGVKEGDEVIVFGEALSLQTLASWAGTIPYEIMTGISQRVKRVYFDE